MKDFINNSRQKLKSDSNIFWVAMQSNQLADTDYVKDDFKEAIEDMKEDLTKDGWILPQLEANMRNQINISNIKVESYGAYRIQSSVTKLETGKNIVGELSILLRVKSYNEWKKKKDQILTHCVQEMNKKDKKNVVILHDSSLFEDVGKDLKRLIKDKTVIEYPSNQGKQKDISNIKDFIKMNDHILFTKQNYFNGCEAPKIINLNYGNFDHRNAWLRGVQNVRLVYVGGYAVTSGMKEDNRFC